MHGVDRCIVLTGTFVFFCCVWLLLWHQSIVRAHMVCGVTQTLLPGESTTLSVLFLAREEGAALGTLVLETSVGAFLFQVSLSYTSRG